VTKAIAHFAMRPRRNMFRRGSPIARRAGKSIEVQQ
jgi:hypothetical protein